MTNERFDRENDSLVSASYQDLATERTPEHLDDAILRKARAAARPAYGRLRLWVRPLAWAATIAISLAIVLQVTQVPDPGFPASELSQPVTGNEVAKQAADDAVAETFGEVTDAAARESRGAKEMPAAGRLATDSAATRADAFVPADVEALREAEDMARMRSGSDEVALTAAGAAPAPLEKNDDQRFCDAEARATAASWIQCIEQLEANDKLMEARAERLVFERTHPDY